MKVLFPEDYFMKGQPDEMYSEQFEAFTSRGFCCATINLELLTSAVSKFRTFGDGEVVYRGWMLTENEYQLLASAIQRAGFAPLTSVSQYLAVHHLPQWYDRTRDLSPETVFFEHDVDIVTELEKLKWGKYFLKDYVKSVKTGSGSLINSPEMATEVVANMVQYRGGIEGGICVRRVEDFVPNSEVRYFVIEGEVYGAKEAQTIPDVVKECAGRIESPFFSIDAAKLADGTDRIVELGDGQVSDLVGWSAERMASIWEIHRPR